MESTTDLSYWKQFLRERLNISLGQATLQPVTGGLFNEVYRVGDEQQEYYVKRYLDKPVSGIFTPPEIPATQRRELAFKVHDYCRRIEGNKSHVPAIRQDEASNTLVIAGVANGKPLLSYLAAGKAPVTALLAVSRVLARLHTASHNVTAYTEQPLYLNTVFRDYKLQLQYYELASHLEPDIAVKVRTLADQYKMQQLCLLHGDINTRNIVLNENTEAIGIIDFEQAHVGHPVYDLAYLLSELLIHQWYYASEVMQQAIRRMLELYFGVNTTIRYAEVRDILNAHIGVQILYRFLGPSRNSWTYYVESPRREEIIAQAKGLLKY
ncbi:aminoglycoside phosphotransferase family protein [Chitinophaga sp. Cy-1792]|uniref:aminoglycoside phosphotransferase family protein n=1 Tax=Chitinophaga sp. Cy-1792 TaxID=2608339 RepID=UPI0014246A1D|nr:aminoglycoside phosphotransferase family protein [Chitinophaga sp. Cy-1792]NIG54478.1 aminoglycoside phosphotransferase family protein [Chitinophaga sp. Cy-1792]